MLQERNELGLHGELSEEDEVLERFGARDEVGRLCRQRLRFQLQFMKTHTERFIAQFRAIDASPQEALQRMGSETHDPRLRALVSLAQEVVQPRNG